jgi:hypothetical protein
MKQDQQKKDSSIFDRGTTRSIIFAILATWAMTIKLPMRSACGRSFVGMHVLVGPVWIWIFSEVSKTPELVLLIPVFWLACFTNGLTRAWKTRKGLIVPVNAPGDSWLAKRLFFFIKGDYGLHSAEIFLSTAIGGIWSVVSHSPGVLNYFFFGSFAMAVMELAGRLHHQRFINAARRAATSQQDLSQRLRRRF